MEETLRTAEYRLLCRAVQEACRLLGWGEAEAGARCLLTGLARASRLQVEGEPWARDLRQAYASALAEYGRLVEGDSGGRLTAGCGGRLRLS